MRRQIIQIIDAGLPLFDFVARLFGVPRNVIGWSRYRVLPDLTRINHRDIGTILRLLSAIPASIRPQGEIEWRRFDAQLNLYFRLIATALQIPAFLLPLDWSMDGNPRGRNIERIVMNWLAEDAQLVAHSGVEKHDRNRAELEEAMDFIGGFAEAFRIRLRQRYVESRAVQCHHEPAMFEWLESIRLAEIVGLSRSWHRRMALDAPEPSPTVPLHRQAEPTWPVLLPDAWSIENRIIVQLTDRQGLIDEGDALCHCIGSYDARCRAGGSAIFSVRSINGDSLSTLELDLMDSGWLTIRAHKVYRNGTPSDDCQLAAMALVELLNGDAGIEGRASMAERRRLVEEGKLAFARNDDSPPEFGVELAWTVVQGSRHAIHAVPEP